MTPRPPLVVAALESERDYQRHIAASFRHQGKPSVGEELLLISEYAQLACTAWRTTRGDAAALEELRKLAGIVCRCFENHGVAQRPALKLCKDGTTTHKRCLECQGCMLCAPHDHERCR
jgi:hypothetical protein